MSSTDVTHPFQENGQRIRRARKLLRTERVAANHPADRHMGAHDFAEKVGCSPRHLFRLESGEHRPSPELRDRIVEVTGTTERIESDDDEEEDLSVEAYCFTRTGLSLAEAGEDLIEELLAHARYYTRRAKSIQEAMRPRLEVAA